MRIGIATDTNCGLTYEEAKEQGIWMLPMPFYINDECFLEQKSITMEEFFARMAAGENVKTSQPSPTDVMDLWNEALQECDELIYIPLSSGLSGACQTAEMMSHEEEFEGKVFVVDNGRVATPMYRSILDAKEMIAEGLAAADIKAILDRDRANMVIYVTVNDLDHLKKGGRVSASSAAIGKLLNIKPVMRFDVGMLDVHKKCRGMKAARKEMLLAIEHDMKETFREYYEKDEIYLLVSSSSDKETTEDWIKEVKDYFGGMEVLYVPLSMGLSCHIGQNGLGVSVSCRPRR